MIMENDTFKIPKKYLNMSSEELKKEEEKILKELGKTPSKTRKLESKKKLIVAGTTFLPYL